MSVAFARRRRDEERDDEDDETTTETRTNERGRTMTTMTTTPRAFGRELDANETRIGSDSPKMTMTPARAGLTKRSSSRGMTTMNARDLRARGAVVSSPSTPSTPLSARASALLREQRALASPLRAATAPERRASAVKSTATRGEGESATKRDAARLRELNSMLLKQLVDARAKAAEAESAREGLREETAREVRASRAKAAEAEEAARALRAAAKRAKKEGNSGEDSMEEAKRLRELNARLVREVSVARNVVKARERDQDEMKEVAAEADRRADALEAEMETKRKTLERVQMALAGATERAAAGLRANIEVQKLTEANAVLMGELAALRESAESDGDSLRAQIDAKSEALTGARADLAKAEAEVKALSDSKAGVDALRTLNTTLLHQIKTLRVKADQSLNLSRALDAKERELSQMAADLKAAESAKVDADEDVNKLRHLNVVLIQEISEMKENAEASAEAVAAKESELDAARMALELVEEEQERTQGDVNKLRELNTVVMAQIKTLKKASLDDRAAFKANLDSKSAELSRARADVARLEKAAAASDGELEKALLKQTTLSAELSTLKKIAEENMATNAHLAAQVKEKKIELADVKEQLAAAQAQASRLDAAENDVSKLRELNSVLIAQVKTLKVVQTENDSLAKALRERSGELEKVQLQLAAAERAKATGEKVSEVQIANLRELNTRIIQRMAEVKEEQRKKFQQLIDSKSLELSMAKADLDKATKEIATGRKDTASLQKNIDKFRVMNAELNGSIKALESEIAAEKESTAEMREAILDSRAECENLKSRLQAKDDELESAWSALMCVNADLKHALHDASGMRALVEKRSEELEETNVNVDRLRDLNAMLIERLHRAKKATLEAEALNAEFAAARTQAEVTIRQEEAKVAALEQQLKEKDSEYTSTTTALRAEMEAGNNASTQRLADLQAQTHRQIQSLERQLEYAKLDLDKVRRSEQVQIEDQKRSAEEIESLLAQVAQTEASAKKDAAEASKHIYSLQKEIAAQDASNKTLTKKVKSTKAEIKALEEKLAEAQSVSSQRWKDLANMSKDLQDAFAANKAKDQAMDKMRVELRDLINTAERFTRLAREKGDEVKSMSVQLTQTESKAASQEKRIAHLNATLQETSSVRDELSTKVSALERKGGVAEITIRAAAEHLYQANARVRSLEHQLNSERAEFERTQNSLTQSINAAERSMEENMCIIANLEAKYQETLQMLLIERDQNAEERGEMRKEIQFVNTELESVSLNLEKMIERNNRGILLKVAGSDVYKLVFGSAPTLRAKGVKAVVRLGMLGGIATLACRTVNELKNKIKK